MKPTIMFLVGMPAVGKSTFIKEMRYDSDPNVYIHSTDNIIMEIIQGTGMAYDDVFAELSQKPFPQTIFGGRVLPTLKKRFERAVREGKDIVVDMVNESKYKRNLTLESIDPDEYVIKATVFGHQPWIKQDEDFIDAVVYAVGERARATGKSVPEVALHKMFEGYEPPTPEEGFVQVNYIDPLNPNVMLRSNPFQGA